MKEGEVRIWPVPIALGIASTVGLIAALVGDGWWDAVSWLGLGAPVAVCGVCLVRARRKETAGTRARPHAAAP